ncbi:MAG: histidine--tRNA ligase [Halobacteriovorax sp.]|nr:histidine--tRNA ligase [Halobacteriovorax sp.]|tara:strand:+ start:58600 stop:59907 length:1308 start_codon:yes stop_codon:yes gene_type:complete
MTLSKKPYKGTRDFFPEEKRIRDYMFSKMKETAQLFAYESYDGPLLEEVELYKAKSGEELINDQIYSFNDRGERFVAIRPEMTPTVARMVAQVHREVSKPIRWFSIPNLYRYERPQKGRLREHWQFNVDVFGAPKILGELEIIQLGIKLMQSFGANSEHFEILINDRAIVDNVFKDLLNCSEDECYKLYKLVDRSKKLDKEKFEKQIDETSLTEEAKEIFKEYLKLNSIDLLNTFIQKHSIPKDSIELIGLYERLQELNLSEYVVFDPTIVRGLDYYTGIVFEIFDKNPENRRAICGGGSYANILKIFNEPSLPGVGFGLGDVTLKDFLITHNLLPDFTTPTVDLILTTQDEDGIKPLLSLAHSLRSEKISVFTQLEPLKIKKVFSLAEKKGAKFAAILGSQEIENGLIQIKNLSTKDQKEFKIDNIEDIKGYLA